MEGAGYSTDQVLNMLDDLDRLRKINADLLGACEALLACKIDPETPKDDEDIRAALRDIRAAVASAKGQQ